MKVSPTLIGQNVQRMIFLFKQFNWFLKVEYYVEACFQILILKYTAFLLNFLNII